MLEKARREHSRLSKNFDIDNIFNFFVTAYHVRDYVLNTGFVPQTAVETFLKDPDLKDCRDLCDKGKHLILTKRKDPTTITMSGCIGGTPIGVLPIGAGNVWILVTETRSVDVQALSDRVLNKWERFFCEHGM